MRQLGNFIKRDIYGKSMVYWNDPKEVRELNRGLTQDNSKFTGTTPARTILKFDDEGELRGGNRGGLGDWELLHEGRKGASDTGIGKYRWEKVGGYDTIKSKQDIVAKTMKKYPNVVIKDQSAWETYREHPHLIKK